MILLATKENVHHKLNNVAKSNSKVKIETLKYFFATENFLFKEVADYIIDSFSYSLGHIDSIENSDLTEINDWFIDNSTQDNFSIYQKVKPAKIIDFSINVPFVEENQPFLIQWEAINYSRAYINGEEVPISNNEYETKISGYQKFQLIVENEHYKAISKPLEIQPVRTPQILEFNASETHIRKDEEVLLTWKTKDSKRSTLFINNKEINTQQKNEHRFIPRSSVICELTVYALNDLQPPVSKTCNIFIVDRVRIIHFRSNKNRILESDKILLSWSAANATKIVLLPLQEDVSGLSQIELSPTKTTTYTLEVSNEVSRERQDCPVIIHSLPKLDNISFPTMPSLVIALPEINLNTTHKNNSIVRQLKNARWYNKLFSLSYGSLISVLRVELKGINKKTSQIFNRSKNE
ncbi:MAG: hypothetical protein HWE22_19255 [Flavobacteriales bacterium]|nr:hypothetical protein [Flavobacteriales bacterium]